jgi:hypothetical protein
MAAQILEAVRIRAARLRRTELNARVRLRLGVVEPLLAAVVLVADHGPEPRDLACGLLARGAVDEVERRGDEHLVVARVDEVAVDDVRLVEAVVDAPDERLVLLWPPNQLGLEERAGRLELELGWIEAQRASQSSTS